MKLRLYDVIQNPVQGSPEKLACFFFSALDGNRYKAKILMGGEGLEVEKRWYNLLLGFITAHKKKQNIFIIITDAVILKNERNELDPKTEFKIVVDYKMRNYSPTVHEPPLKESIRKDLHG